MDSAWTQRTWEKKTEMYSAIIDALNLKKKKK
jgi:hypothetical protein